MPLSTRYSVRQDVSLEARICDDGVLLFDASSGSTHLVDHATWHRLTALPGFRVVGTMPNVPRMSPQSDDGLLQALERAGIIERC